MRVRFINKSKFISYENQIDNCISDKEYSYYLIQKYLCL